MARLGLRWMCLVALCAVVSAQTAPDDAGFVVASGTDAGSGIEYAMIAVAGKRIGAAAADGSLPRLTAQCTKSAQGKLRFELLADAGETGELKYMAPWKATKEYPNWPELGHANVTMEFLGYVKQKPMKRQWVSIWHESGEWQYATPGMQSSNMDNEQTMLRYLLALPTMRLTLPSMEGVNKPVVVEFETAKWQKRVKAEPMCAASGL